METRVSAKRADARMRIAVMPLLNKTGESGYNDVGELLAERTAIGLAGDPRITVVERARLNEVIKELLLSETEPLDSAKAAKIGKLLGANYMAFGSLTRLGKQFTVTFRIVDVETGEIIGGALSDSDGNDHFVGATTDASKQLLAAVLRP